MSEFPQKGEDVEQWADRRSMEQTERTRQLIFAAGRPDIVAELDAKLRDVRTGVDGARSTWHSISEAQRRVLLIMSTGRHLIQRRHQPTRYDARGEPDAVGNVCSIKTVRCLCARDLCHVDGGAINPEAKIVLTERGRFVLSHGPMPAGQRY